MAHTVRAPVLAKAAALRSPFPVHNQPGATLNEAVCFLQSMLDLKPVPVPAVITMSSKINELLSDLRLAHGNRNIISGAPWDTTQNKEGAWVTVRAKQRRPYSGSESSSRRGLASSASRHQ